MEKKEKIVGSIIIIIGCIIFLTIGQVLSRPINRDNKYIETQNSHIIVDNTNTKDESSKETLKNIIVEIKGEVKKPNVYTLSYGSRVYDLIQMAGGYTEKADTMMVNSSLKLKDEDCVIIYSKDQVLNTINTTKAANNIISGNTSSTSFTKGEKGKLNINTATKEELMNLPGIGEVTAQRIIDYREEKGGFSSIEELNNISRIGEKTIDKFRDDIEVR